MLQKDQLHILLIGNYVPDQQQSMHRFLKMLEKQYLDEGLKVSCVYPTVLFGRLKKNTLSGLGKWLSYIDKYLVFPMQLLLLKKKYNQAHHVFHICDHSNAMYIQYLPVQRTLITCHDVLAIRGAKGFKDAYCEASAMGKVLQNWILKSLQKFQKIAFVSKTTEKQFMELCPNNEFKGRSKVIYNALNGHFYPIEINHALNALHLFPQLQNEPFILHVGSGLPRKNRKLILEFFILLKDKWPGNVCFVGEALDPEMQALIHQHGIAHRVIHIQSASHQILLALYRLCSVFVFPSFAEGFGWPVIEAQASAAPVITSNIEPMPEIAGSQALIANPYQAQEFADAFLYLQELNHRQQHIETGLLNAKRFDSQLMIQDYIALYLS